MRLVKLSGLSGRYSRQPLTSLPSFEPRRYFFGTNRERTNRRASATKIIKINSKEYLLVVLEPNCENLEVVLGTYRGGTSEVSIFFVVPISRQRGGGGCQLAVVCVSPRPPAWLRLLLLLSFDD